MMAEVRRKYKSLVGKPEGKSTQGGRKDNIKTGPKKLWREDVDWIHMSEVRVHWQVLMNTVMNHLVP